MTSDDRAFIDGWNALDAKERRLLRRLVRTGRPIDDPKLEALAPAYARYQSTRMWARLFWLWFVPGMFLALGVAAGVHPLFVGAVIALGAQAVMAHYKLRKTARVDVAGA
jgi:hypothetical protein